MRIAIIGDVHGQLPLLAENLARIRDELAVEAAIQVGDFGFHKTFMASRRRRLPAMPVPLYVVCGNHEDHAWLHRCRAQGAEEVWRESNLFYQPRPSLVEFDGDGIGFLGGALNIDRPQAGRAAKGTTNFIAGDQCDQAVELFNRTRPSLLVTHSCPAAIGVGMQGNPALGMQLMQHVILRGYDPGPQDDAGERELTRLWYALAYRPVAWVFGHFHYHRQVDIEGTRFACASLVEQTDTILLWDTTSTALTVAGLAAR